jgi:very-short-patch-repair endonuclease
MHDVVAELADRQEGMVASWQLLGLGYTRQSVSRRVGWKEFVRVHTGVFFVGHCAITFKGRCMAAALACGPEAAISHHAAAALYDLRPIPQVLIDVTAPKRRCRAGIRSHISAVADDQRTHIDAIPVTTLERTCLDYAEQATPRQLTAALEAANRRDLLDLRKLLRAMNGSPGSKGIKTLKAALTDMDSDPQWTQSPPEQEFLHLIAIAGLPRPQTNRLIEGHLVDFVWPAQRLIVEVDSYDFHTSRNAFEADRRRDAELQRHGWRVLRITARRLHNDPHRVIADLRTLLNL